MASEAKDVEQTNVPKELEKYVLNFSQLHNIRKTVINEMNLGLENNKLDKKEIKKESSLKMLNSHVFGTPDGNENGDYFTLDWGGTNYRVLKISLNGRKEGYQSKQLIEVISDDYRLAKDEVILFDYLAQKLKDFMEEDNKSNDNDNDNENNKNKNNKNNDEIPIGFCFSFPMYQPSLDKGILLEWTKGFTVPNVVGNDVSKLMNDSFARLNMNNVKIDSIVNDTVGTLLACAYENDNTKLGLILGTGTNCAYIEPTSLNKSGQSEIINIEWGNFARTLKKENVLCRVEIDELLDKSTANAGSYLTEKMISGRYMGELARLACIEYFGNKITDYKEKTLLTTPWKFDAKTLSDVVACAAEKDDKKMISFLNNTFGLNKFNINDCKQFVQVCRIITYRAADVAASLLSGVLFKAGLYCDNTKKNNNNNNNNNNDFVLSKDYINDKKLYATVGVDGSVYGKNDFFRERLHSTLNSLVGDNIYQRIRMVKSKDGSGKGAALAAACNTN